MSVVKDMKLMSPITISGMELRNRVVMPPMAVSFGFTNPVAGAYYAERAKGGTAAIVVPAVPVDVFQSDRFLGGIRQQIIEPVRKYGAKVGVQLWYGNQSPTLAREGVRQKRVAPSAGSPAAFRSLVQFLGERDSFCCELTLEEIQGIQQDYVMAVVRAQEAGFDFVEIHGCHGITLPHQFLSPRDNRRTDIYGGDLQGRLRFGLELASKVREALGNGYPLFWRLSAEESLPGGFTLDDAIQNAMELAKCGVDVIDVTYGHEDVDESYTERACSFTPEGYEPEGVNIPFARAIKRHLFVPVIGAGGIRSPAVAERIISEGSVDLVAVGRQLLADPYWVEKAAAGRWDEIRPCLGCGHCLDVFMVGKPVRCAVNPFLGREKEWEVKPAEKPRKVFVIGGGPGGIEASLIASSRGHKVTLFEREQVLGGQLLASGKSPAKDRVNNLREYLVSQLQKSKVEVRCGVEFNTQMIESDKPDAVVVATGAKPLIPDIPGVDRENVVTALDVLLGKCEVGDEVIVLGAGLTGCDVAEFLAAKGKKVFIIEMQDVIAPNKRSPGRISLMSRLALRGITWSTGIECEAITDEGLVMVDRKGKKTVVKADNIVLGAGSKAEEEIAKQLAGKVKAIYSVGDCVNPREIVNAIEEGASVGMEL